MIEPLEAHLTLIRNASWRWEDCEYGAPAIDCKRPFGNSNVEGDLEELLPDLTEDERVTAFRQLPEVIQYMAVNWPTAEPAPSPVHQELAALAAVVEAVEPLSPETKPRVLRYLNDRFGGQR